MTFYSASEKQWRCDRCAQAVPPEACGWPAVCPDCGAALSFHPPQCSSWKKARADLPGIWRYWRLLPLFSQQCAISANVALAPPVPAPRLRERLGVDQVWLLPHSLNPTGTFKDLEAAFVISKCLECGLDDLCWHSTGNTARSLRWHAARAGLRNTSIIPRSSLGKLRGAPPDANARILAYDGELRDISGATAAYAKRNAMTYVAPMRWKLEGKTVMAHQIAEAIPETTLIVQTIASGFGFLGMRLGFQRQIEAGLRANSVPRFGLFQIHDADAIAALFARNHDAPAAPPDIRFAQSEFEPTLQSASAMATYGAVREAAIQTRSTIETVGEDETHLYRRELEEACQGLGVPVCFAEEKSPFISWAGLRKQAAAGRLSPTERICLIITGAPGREGPPIKPDAVLTSEESPLPRQPT